MSHHLSAAPISDTRGIGIMAFDTFLQVEDNIDWVNHHENIVRRVTKRLTIDNEVPQSPTMAGMRATAARLQVIAAAAVAAGVQVRACGARWSFSDIPVAENGWIVETDRLGWRFNVAEGDVEPTSVTLADDLILAQCGAKISKINEALETPQKRRTLRTMGASNGQTWAARSEPGYMAPRSTSAVWKARSRASSFSRQRRICGSNAQVRRS
jgi:hypothetical protein